MLSREERIQRIVENPEISVLIIGAGINGIGTFLDLALQGVDVLMVERGDYCSGASAASSHMVHGGIRYLENGEFGLVREAVQERNRLLENAPHLVMPLATTFPIFCRFSGLLNAPLKFLGLLDSPSERGAIVLKAGMLLYDFYARKQMTVPRHAFKNREDSLSEFPRLNPNILYTGTYYDGAMPSPERIAIELITDATNECDLALPLNYMRVVSAKGDQVILRDEEGLSELNVIPKIVVNAAGPWIDQTNSSIGLETEYIGGTKGSHIILACPALRKAIGSNEFFFENEDGRIVLIYPLEDKVLIGTTDIKVDDPDKVVITDEEVRYLIDMIGKVFPSIVVDTSQIVFTYSGVRPLVNSRTSNAGQISRDHQIQLNEQADGLDIPVYSLIGGKWTTYRAFSEKVSKLILNRLGLERVHSTQNYRIGGGKSFPKTPAEKEQNITSLLEVSGQDRQLLETLISRYGTKVSGSSFLPLIKDNRKLHSYPDYGTAEIAFIVQNEDVVHLDDFIFRRTMLGKLGRITANGLEEIGQEVGNILGWDDDKLEKEIRRFDDISILKHRMKHNRFVDGH